MINRYEIDPDGFNAEVEEHAEILKAQDLSYEQLLMIAARALTEAEYNEGVYHCDLHEVHSSIECEEKRHKLALEKIAHAKEIAERMQKNAEQRSIVAEYEKFSAQQKAEKLSKELKEAPKHAAKHAADALHDQPGGSRELARKICEIWAQGNFESRETCADQEWQEIGFGSRKAARNALIGTPDPSPWTAMRKKPSKC